jgi:predicted GTPase
MNDPLHCVIMGAAGRDFHDFQTFFRTHPEFQVCAFTAAQIPFIETRTFPKALAGADYNSDIPIFPEERLAELIERFDVDFVFLAYSDLPHEEVMHKASLAQSCGASFGLLGPKHTQLRSRKPVVAITAVRTGAGKSPLAQATARHLVDGGRRVGIIRHPMPYGDLSKQAVERFGTLDDLNRYECTVEEREEYEPYLEQGLVIYAGVNYREILRAAEKDADAILWDGGNNDYPFLSPNLSIVVVDALRAGHEVRYYPGETNLRAADVLVVNKVREASSDGLATVRANIRTANPSAEVIESDLDVTVDDPSAIAGRRVVVVEDGPTVTHGGMSYGAGTLAARQYEAGAIIDPRPHASGTIAAAYTAYPHLTAVVPALGYSPDQRRELADTIHACQPDVVVDASPARLDRLLDLHVPVVRVGYRFRQLNGPPIFDLIERALTAADAQG